MLSPLQKYQLEQFCRKHSLDIQLIDNSLTYSENLEKLKELIALEDEDEFLAQAKAMMEWYESRELSELYGISEKILETLETPLLIFRFIVKYPRRLKRVIRTRITKFEKHTECYDGYLIIKGQITEIYEVIEVLPQYLRIVGSNMKYNKFWQYIPNKGWVRRPS